MTNNPDNALPSHLDALLKDKVVSEIKDTITSLPSQEKGPAFEQLLAKLYRGNGWLAQVQGGRGDDGADILLYHPKTPSHVSLIVQAKNHAQRLTYDQTRLELLKFEEKARGRYNCNNFRLVSVSGFVKEASNLGDFNMLIDEWEHVIELIEHYDPENITEPQIELFAHNRVTYEHINELWEEENHVAAVQATGTGKSFLISKVLTDSADKCKIVLAPSNYILEQQHSKIPWLSNIVYMTYAKLGRMSLVEIAELNFELIVLDEFHRCGADVWGAGVQTLLDINPEAKVLGTSATPIRYLDNERDMVEELFDGVIAVDLSLAEAIVRRILPAPTYISALYTLNEEIDNLLEDVEASRRTDVEKAAYREEIKKIKLEWETTSGVPEILKKRLPPGIDKVIVFCRDKQHLDEMEIEVQRWFLKAGTHTRRKTYRVLSSDPESNRNLEDFKSAGGRGTVHLMFAIDMLNEGLHIPEVGAVLLLRPTESPIIFYQQIGRCIEVGKDHTPVIFDLVNNFRNVRANDFIADLEDARESERQRRVDHGLPENAPCVHIEELAKSIEQIFEEIRERLGSWEVMFEALIEYKKQYGDCIVPDEWPNNPQLGTWAGYQRLLKKNDKLCEDRLQRLVEIGFVWNVEEVRWEENFTTLYAFKEVYGGCNVPSGWPENPQLANWVGTQRRFKKNDKLPVERFRRLNEIGFAWDKREATWDEMFAALCAFKEVHGDCNVPQRWPENPQLASWAANLRTRKKDKKLSTKQVQRLEEVGFVWHPEEARWEESFAALCAYKEIHDHCNVPDKCPENLQLGTWVLTQRHRKKDDKLPADRIQRLEEVGFVWDKREADWEERFSDLCAYKELHQDCNVPARWDGNPQLAQWVVTQKSLKKDNKLREDRILRLEEIGFVWERRETTWEERFAELCVYKEVHRHCNVPNEWPENPQLGTWVGNQRTLKKNDSLRLDRVRRLDGIGFEWEPSKK